MLLDIIGYIAIVFSLLGFLTKSKKYMLIYGIISTLLFGISIAFGYGGYNGLIVSLISILSKLSGLFLDEKIKKILIYFSPLIAIGAYFFLPEGIRGIIPAFSLVFIIIADQQRDILKMKYWYYGSNLLWLLYGFLCNSFPAILFDILGFITLTYSIYLIKKNRN